MSLVGSQVARYQISPKCPNVSTVHAEACIDLAAAYGLTLDEWQANTVRIWFRMTPEGRWAASTWGLSVARQNGKNGALEAVELYLLVMMGCKILHTSHLLTSARKAFKRLMQFFGRKVNDPNAKYPELNQMVVEIRKTNGQEAIELSNGGLIELGARTGGAGRGSSFDFLIVDEAQEYEEDEQEALEPTTSASPSGDPVTVYMGTPPKVVGERGEPFIRVRSAAVTGRSKRTAWVEHSPQGELDKMTEIELQAFVRDRRNWAEGNPALGIRLAESTIEGEMERWSAKSFARERLNMFPSPAEVLELAFSEKVLKALQVGADELDHDLPVSAFGVDMNPEKTKVSICAAVPGETKTHLELAANSPFSEEGISALVNWLWERCKRRVPVVMDAFSPARDLLEAPLKKRGLTVRILDTNEFIQACGQLYHAVKRERSITWFVEQEHFFVSMKSTVKEPIKNRPGSFKWNRSDLEVDLMPTMAATCALYGSVKFGRRKRSSGGPDGGSSRKRHAVVL
ncbi:hypothetical protein ACTXIU_12350 [Glutamicibacter arilaitensis]|uniref:hypothetical protein n=1 Tax=Glutamicibacter arilaitensis TaxID=256701 RepID=UPI003FD04D88